MKIRAGVKEDLPQVLELIKELAEYEKGLDQVTNTVEMMEKDGFGDHPIFEFFVAELDGFIVGLSLCYFRYSTWKGKRLYLEDIIVTQEERGKGLGKQLFEATFTHGKRRGCTGMTWQVLDWNKSAINFYTKYYQAQLDEEWINCHIDF
ncbi:MAG: GNAT family N-acetyltransferase [Bacteroidota bacterium]